MERERELKILTVLIDVYDASDELLDLSQTLSGCCVDSDSLVMRIMYTSEAIKWFSPLYQAGIGIDCENESGVECGLDWEESAVGRILDGGGSAEERARMLMGE